MTNSPWSKSVSVTVDVIPDGSLLRRLACATRLIGRAQASLKRAADWVRGKAAPARFLFPRDFVLTADDREVEFATMFGKAAVKARFNLKNMAIKGKLGL